MENDNNLQSVTESLYKQNLELAVKNKTLSLLSKLYETSILTLEPKDLAGRVNTTIQTDFSFELVGILFYDQTKDVLSPLAFAESDRFKKAGASLETISIPEASKNSFLNKVIQEKNMATTNELKDIWDSLVSPEMFDQIASEGHIESSILYPLIIEGKVIGILILSLNRKYSELVDYEKESIKAFINVIAVALDKALLYEKLKITNAELKTANEGQASLMHFMNHQIKGRLGNAKNIFAELLTDDYGEMPVSVRPLLEKGLDEANIGINYVQGILKGASAESGTLPYEMKPMDFKELVEKSAEKQKETAEAKHLSFALAVEPGEYMISGDCLELGEAVRNLIDNSINYTLEGSISITLSHVGENIRLTIADTGVGMSADDKSKLFKSGGRGAESLKVNTNSTGFGLVFVKGVVEAHKGKVWAESEGRGKGSTFYMELPQK